MDKSIYVFNEMRKILQINPVIRVSTSTGRIMEEIGELIRAKGWESYIAYSKGRDGVKNSKSKVIPIGNKWSVFFHGLITRLFDRHGLSSDKATLEFIKKIQGIAPDIIHIHNIHGYFLNYKLLFKFLSKSNIPIIWTIHDCWAYTGHCYHYSYVKCYKWQMLCSHCPQKTKFPSSFFQDRSRRNFLDKKEAFTSIPISGMLLAPVSNWLKTEMQKSFLNNYQFQVIHNGVDTELFRICDTKEVIEKYKIGKKSIILGVASIWSDEKGLSDFIKLAGIIQDDQQIVLVGINEKQKAILPQNILAISRTENIHQLAQLYSAADVLVNPTWQDNYPTVNLEAISCGTPVVTYRTGGSIEAITENTGCIIEQGDIQGLLSAVNRILQKGKSFYRDQCREYALKNFRKQDRYLDYVSLYEKLMKN